MNLPLFLNHNSGKFVLLINLIMQKSITTFVTLATALSLSAIKAQLKTPASQDFQVQKTAIAFTENKGQIHDQNYNPRPDVLYSTMVGNMAVHLKASGVSYQLYRIDKYKDVEDEITKKIRKEIDQQTIYRIDLNWLNANNNFTSSTDASLSSYDNYYTESCPEGGALNVKSYTGVTFHNLYKGIDLHYYEKNNNLKYDFIVAPNSNYKQIQLKVNGAQVELQKNGSLVLNTPLGKIIEGEPIVYQRGKRLKASWLIFNNTLSFDIENYNPNIELIIDPITRVWGTYYGGSGLDFSNSCSADATGNIYMAGFTSSNTGTIIATSGAHQSVHSGGSFDAYLVKFNGSGMRLWSTYYGGNAGEAARACAVDASGNVFMVGETASTTGTLIASSSSHQSILGGSSDAFIVKFDASGVRQWGTYYGGSGDDIAYSCATDPSGNIFVGGHTTTNTGTTIANSSSHQITNGGGVDAFLVKFNTSGIRQWGTYYGGTGQDYGFYCATDASGNVYLTGETTSNTGTNIATASSHQSTYGGGTLDGFLVKFDGSGIRQWGTYYGGNAMDRAYSCSADGIGNVFITGQTTTNTGTIIATSVSHQNTYGGSADAFLVKFNSSGLRLWGTYYGGSAADIGRACNLDATGNIFICGETASNSGTSIASLGSFQTINGGGSDAFLVKFNSNGTRLWGTYYGGSGADIGRACVSSSIGNIYLAGDTPTNTGTVIASSTSHQNSYGGGTSDAFLVKFEECVSLTPTIANNSGLCAGSTINFTCNITGTAVPTFSWSGPNSFSSILQNPSILGANSVNVGIYTLTLNNAGCIETLTTQIVLGNPTISVNSATICAGQSFTITPNGANTYTVQGGSTVVSPTTNSSYTIIGTSSAGCLSTNTATCNVIVNPTPTVTVNSGTICSGTTFTIVPNGANTYTIQGGSSTVTPLSNSSYTVKGTNTFGCVSLNTATSIVSVIAAPALSISGSTNTICSGNSIILTASGSTTYTWSTGPISPSINVAPTINTTYTASSTGTNGCVGMAMTTISVNATPTLVINSGSICSGSSFTIAPSGALSYTYSGGSSIVNPTANTTYTVIGSNANGCVSAPSLCNVTVNPLPLVSIISSNTSFICVGQSVILTATGANSYLWNNSSTTTSIIVSPSITTSYTVTGTNAAGCSADAILSQSVATCTEINSIANQEIKSVTVYPNPSMGIYSIDTYYSDKNISIEIEVFDILGRAVLKGIINESNSQLNLGSYPNGVYFLKIDLNGNIKIIKLVKE